MLSLGALGVVYGDIGTSPLYALRECFHPDHGLSFSQANLLGVLSLVFWTLVGVIAIKYMVVIMRADNRGEGGILSLLALSTPKEESVTRWGRYWMLPFGIFGAALLYGDGAITPAISVLSAVEGLKLIAPTFAGYVIPITTVIIVLLFSVQRVGTGRIGVVFGPIILLWFLVLGAMGVFGILQHPEVLDALNPYYAISFFFENGWVAFFVLGSVFLVVTGGEALYADMGHFGKRPIRWAWFVIAMPALVLNYFGQGAILLLDPAKLRNPFYLLAPDWALEGLVVLATMATVIASQALISGVFSISRQAVQLGFLPRLKIIHTSSAEIGQIYIPVMNWALMAGVLWLVFSFHTSSNLAAAYGLAVTGTMLITTLLAFKVARDVWKWNLPSCILVFGSFLLLDAAFFGANLVKVENGGWFPLLVGALIYLLMSTWRKGRKILVQSLRARSCALTDFVANLTAAPVQRVSGSAIYMSGDPWGVPIPMLHNLKHNKVLHNQIAILSITTIDEPHVPKGERLKIEELAPHFYRVIARFGFMETPKMKFVLEALRDHDIHFNITDTTFVLGRETILPMGEGGMPVWREKLFATMAKTAERPVNFFRIPPNQVIEVGIQIVI